MIKEINKEQIEKQAKEILDKFAHALEKVELVSPSKDGGMTFVERDEFERIEKDGSCCEPGFKKRILDNSPVHDEDFIIAEKGSWK